MTAHDNGALPRVLLVAFHFPPFKGSSGIERTLAFCRHLPEAGWAPLVLSAHARAYASTSDERMGDVPADVEVARAPALDAARHLALLGRYPGWTALPDRWSSWALGAIPHGLRMIARRRPRALWSTYPIATAHVAAYALHRLTGLPWIADFRDPMVEYNHRMHQWAPGNPRVRRARLWIEERCARSAARVVFCTSGARRIFLERYPAFPAEHAVVIPNGYDETAFAGIEARAVAPSGAADGVVTLLHSGVLYPGPDRDPGAFLRALAGFLDAAPAWRARLRVVLRATAYDAEYAPVIASLGLDDVVTLAPAIPYREALAEMLAASALLVFQGYTSNPAIPAKVYEYLRARRPILALVDADGDTARLLAAEQVGTVLPIEDAEAIRSGLGPFLDGLVAGTLPVLPLERAMRHDRRHRSAELGALLDACTQPVRAPACEPE